MSPKTGRKNIDTSNAYNHNNLLVVDSDYMHSQISLDNDPLKFCKDIENKTENLV